MAARLDVFTVALKVGAGGTWVDVSADVEASDATVSYTFGRTDRFGDLSPSSLSFELVNNDPTVPGKYTPDNPLGPYYGRLVEGVPVRWTVGALDGPTPATIRYRHWYGEVAILTPVFPDDDHAFARVQVRCVDFLARLGRTPLRDLLTEECIVDGVTALWLLADPSGSLAAAESSPADVGPLVIGGEPSQVTFGQGTGLAFDGLTSTQLNSSDVLDPGWLEIADGVPAGSQAIELWVTYPSELRPGVLDPKPVLLEGRVTGGSCSTFGLMLDEAGKLRPLTWPADGFAASQVVADGKLHQVVVVGNDSITGGIRIYVDGVPLGANNRVFYGLSEVRIGYGVLNGVDGWIKVNSQLPAPWRGTVSRVGLGPGSGALTAPSRYTLGTVMQETAPDRAVRLLTYLRGVTVTAVDDTGTALSAASSTYSGAVVGPQETQNGSLLSALLEAWAGEGGRLWTTTTQYGGAVAPQTGPRVTFAGRVSLRPITPTLTLGNEDDLDGAPTQTRGTDGQVAVVTSSSRALSVTVQDDALAAAIGPVAGAVSSALVVAGELAGLGQDRIARTRAVRTRITALVTDPLTGSAPGGWPLWGALLGLRLGDRIRVTGLPASKLGFSVRDCYLVGGTEDHSSSGSAFRLVLEAADEPAEFWMGDGVYGRVSSDGDLALNAALTAVATSMAVKWTTYGLSTDAADYPLDLDVNGERVTVTAAPAGATSPQTVAVTRGVGDTTARAHTVGELVDVWLTPSVAL